MRQIQSAKSINSALKYHILKTIYQYTFLQTMKLYDGNSNKRYKFRDVQQIMVK